MVVVVVGSGGLITLISRFDVIFGGCPHLRYRLKINSSPGAMPCLAFVAVAVKQLHPRSPCTGGHRGWNVLTGELWAPCLSRRPHLIPNETIHRRQLLYTTGRRVVGRGRAGRRLPPPTVRPMGLDDGGARRPHRREAALARAGGTLRPGKYRERHKKTHTRVKSFSSFKQKTANLLCAFS